MRRLMLLLVAVVVLTTGMAEAQPRLGVLLFGTPATDPNIAAFRRGLSDLGYVEGRNIVLEYRYAEGKAERRSEEHTSELQSLTNLVCRLLLEKKKKKKKTDKHNQEKRKKEGQAHPENQQTRRIQPYVQTISRADNRPVTQSHSRQESERNTRP